MNAKKDDNGYPAWIALSCVDGITPVRVAINQANKGFVVDTTSSISFDPATVAGIDGNHVHTIMGIRSDNGLPMPLYANPLTGGILIDY